MRTYMQVHEKQNNSVEPSTSSTIALRPSRTEQGRHYFLSIHTGKKYYETAGQNCPCQTKKSYQRHSRSGVSHSTHTTDAQPTEHHSQTMHNLKISLIEKDLVENMLEKLNYQFGKISTLMTSGGKVLEYLGTTINYRQHGKSQIFSVRIH